MSAIAFIHTHTTLSHETDPTIDHVCGPSKSDFDALDENEYGILIDYKGNLKDGSYHMYGGHDDDAPVRVYVYDKKRNVTYYEFEIDI